MNKKVSTVAVFFIAVAMHAQILSFSQDTFEFGDINDLHKVTQEVEVKNIGDKPLKIEKIKTSCGCTASTLKKNELAPNETTNVTISFNPKGRSGKQRKQVMFFSNDTESNVKNVNFTANVVPVWNVSPKRLNFTFEKSKSEMEQHITIDNFWDKPIIITNIRVRKPEYFTLILPEKKEILPEESLQVPVKMNSDSIPDSDLTSSIVVTANIGGINANRVVRVIFRAIKDQDATLKR